MWYYAVNLRCGFCVIYIIFLSLTVSLSLSLSLSLYIYIYREREREREREIFCLNSIQMNQFYQVKLTFTAMLCSVCIGPSEHFVGTLWIDPLQRPTPLCYNRQERTGYFSNETKYRGFFTVCGVTDRCSASVPQFKQHMNRSSISLYKL